MEIKKKKILSAKDILMSREYLEKRTETGKYINHEFQDFGFRLAQQLNDMEHKSLYIKLAKEVDRNMLMQALSFARDYPKATTKGRLFMWKLTELKNAKKELKKTKGGNLMMDI